MKNQNSELNLNLYILDVTFGQSVYEPQKYTRTKLTDIIELIKYDCQLKEVVNKIRSESDKVKRNKIKSDNLPYFSLCEFKGRRNKDSFIRTTALVFDLDNVRNIDVIRKLLEGWIYSSVIFTSPSGNGLKLIVRLNKPINTTKDYYTIYEKILAELEAQFNVKFDSSTKDPARITFLSHDPDIFVNANAMFFDTEKFLNYQKTDNVESAQSEGLKKSKEIKKLLKGVPEGERHNSMIKLMGALIKRGLDKESIYLTLKGINQLNSPPMQEDEFDSEFEGAYRSFTFRHKDDDNNNDPRIVAFWSMDKGAVKIDNIRFIEFLEQEGFRKIKTGPNNYELVRLNGNIISRSSLISIQEYIRNYLEDLEIIEWKIVLDQIVKSTKTLFAIEKFNFLKTIKPRILRDEKDKAYLFFNNQYIKITAEKIDFCSYDTLQDCYIWDTSIADFSLRHGCLDIHPPQSEFNGFLIKITKGEENWYKSLICSIGYMLHNYKDPANTKAVIFCDEEIPTANAANGGTGKSLVCCLFKYFKKIVVIDGKNYKSNRPFNFQMIDTNTMVVILDDVRKDFDFESLLSAITSNLVIEKKGKDPITIPFSDAPKFIITTNYTIDGTGNSFDRRKHEIEFSNHYNKYNTPDQEFGHRLFEDWDEDEWTRFYSSVIYYIQQYLRNGLVKYEFKNLWQRKIINATSVDFFDFAENNIEPNREYTKSKLLKDFQEQYPEYDKLKSNTLTKWLKIYAENKNFTMNERKSNKNRHFTFAIAVEGQNEENFEQDPKIINPSAENSTDELFPFMKNTHDNNDSPMDDIF